MIRQEELIKIGRFNKPHGIKGELSFTFSDDSFDESECPFLICELDGIFVPFPLEEYRFKSDSSALVKLKRIDSNQQARILVNRDVYFPAKYINKDAADDLYTWDYFTGYTLRDESGNDLGEIVAIDETTINTLFIVERSDEELLIPATEEMILEIDDNKRFIRMKLPEGMLDLNK